MVGVYVECGHWNRSTWLKLNDMRKKGVGCDVELVGDGGSGEDGSEDVTEAPRYPAHVCILTAGSPHLKSQLHAVHAKSSGATQVRMTGFSAAVLESVLEFMYTGSLAVRDEPIADVQKAAKVLQMRELAILCGKIMDKQEKQEKLNEGATDHFIVLENSLWNKNMWHSLNALRTEKQFCNLTLQIGAASSFDTHACLLLAASSFFRKNLPVSRFEDGVSLCLELGFVGTSTRAIENVLDYIYLGSFSCTSRNLQETLDLASTLKLEELVCLLQGILNKHRFPTVPEQIETTHTEDIYDNEAAETSQVQTVDSVDSDREMYLSEKTLDKENIHQTHNNETFNDVNDDAQFEEPVDNQDSNLPINQTHIEESNQMYNSQDSQQFEQIQEVNSEQLQALLKDAESFKILQKDGEAVSLVINSSSQFVAADSTSLPVLEGSSDMELAYLTGDLNSGAMGQPEEAQQQPEESMDIVTLQQPMDSQELTALLKGKGKQEPNEDRKEKLYDILPMEQDVEITRGPGGEYTCGQCHRTFRRLAEARVHSVMHSGRRPYVCRVCGMAFRYKTNVIAHLKRHTGHKPHRCRMCGKRFLRLWDVQIHERTHTRERPYQCPHCPKTFAQSANRSSHIKAVHQGTGGQNRQKGEALGADFECLQCGKHFATGKSLQLHEKTHGAREEEVRCDDCGERFVTVYSLRRHVRRGACGRIRGAGAGAGAGTRSGPYHEIIVSDTPQNCPHCSVTLSDFEALRDHLLTSGCMDQMAAPPHYFRSGQRFVCFQCSTPFESFRGFREHDAGNECERVLGNDMRGGGEGQVGSLEGADDNDNDADGGGGGRESAAAGEGGRIGEGRGSLGQGQGSLREVEDYYAAGSGFVCVPCGESFVTLPSLKRHRKRGACDKKVRIRSLLAGGVGEVETEAGELEEGEDGEGSKLSTKHPLRTGSSRAKNSSNSGVDIQCDLCGASFARPAALKRHILQAHPTGENTMEGQDNATQETHTSTSTILSNKLYVCRDCGSSFSTAGSVRRHKMRGACDKLLGIKRHRVTEYKVECSGCDKRFASKDSLQKHMKRGACGGIRGRAMKNALSEQYNCFMCNQILGSYSELRGHVEECTQSPDSIVYLKAAILKSRNGNAAVKVKQEHSQETGSNILSQSTAEISEADMEIIQGEFCLNEVIDNGDVQYTCKLCRKIHEGAQDFSEHWMDEHSVKCRIDVASEGLSDCYICPYCAFVTELFDSYKGHVYNCANFPDVQNPEAYLYRNRETSDVPNEHDREPTLTRMKVQPIVKQEKLSEILKPPKPRVTITRNKSLGIRKTVVQIVNVPISCPVCEIVFETKKGLSRHQKRFPDGSCKQSSEKPEKVQVVAMQSCQKCDAKFPTIPLLRQHYVDDHQFVILESPKQIIA